MRRTRHYRTFIRERSLPFVKAIRDNGTKHKERSQPFFPICKAHLRTQGKGKQQERREETTARKAKSVNRECQTRESASSLGREHFCKIML
ncbi:hypothetical protein POVWA2_000720 [Plasmodium ovale wallikeri]|uniref:Uncharacterized protein n=1 Tax=Plasmodium ovale wallikeri TaxID=864142 RepID=A0A1A8YGU8_PLAOA|nr:hypothetical protein POVWA1_000460 [Plasmodium ovale wallikeri]SBT30781.1 hypothetical protein POVWA2_000720 [Plasmodium ovale wallikeri]